MSDKVLILTNSTLGLYNFRRELISELAKNYDVIASAPELVKKEELSGIGCTVVQTNLDRRGINPISDMKLFVNYIKLLKKEKPRLVITYTIKPNVYGGLACRLMKILYVANITGLGTTFQNNGLLKKIVVTLYKLGLKKAKTVFFENSENQQVFLDNDIVSKERTCLLNGAGVNLEHYQVSEYPSEESIHFLFVGRVMKEKGVDELFTAIQRLRADGIDCSLDVLGGYEEDYKEQITQYEADGWLNYHGYQVDVRPYIDASHCFVLPSYHEGMANTNLECAASGRPVITSNIHGCLEAVEDVVSGFLCEKQDADSLYEVMKKFADLPYEQRKAMGLAGRKRMEEIFDKRRVVQETIEHLF